MLTLGHSTLPIDVFLGVLADNGVRLVADIRTIPQSRHNPQSGQDSLSSSLRQASLEYCWLSALGGLRKLQKDLLPLNAGWRNASFRGSADSMQTAALSSAVQELLALAERSSVVLLCAEAVPWRCHRSLVADALSVRGIAVQHIFHGKGGASHRRSHQLTPFARVEGTRIWYPAEDSLFREDPPPGDEFLPGTKKARPRRLSGGRV